MKKPLLALIVLGSCMVSAHANVGLSLSAGTTGVGLHLIKSYSESVNFRFGFNGYDHETTETTDSARYDVKVKLRTFDALVDYHPSRGAFRLTGGLIYNGNKFNATAIPTGAGSYTFNGVVYSTATAGDVTGEMEFKKIAPYLGIGFGDAVARNKGWGFTADLGVMFQGSPDVNLRSNNCTAPANVCNQLASDLAAENARLRDDAKDYRYYPVLRVGLSYKF